MEDQSKLGTIEYLVKCLDDIRVKTDADFALMLNSKYSEEYTLNPVPEFSFRFSENRQKEINRGDIYSPSLKKVLKRIYLVYQLTH